MDKGIGLNESACKQVGELISGLTFRPEFYHRPFLNVQAPAETKLRGYFYAVAICHQTYTLHHPGMGLFGWDYLEFVFTRLMQEQDRFLAPGALQHRRVEEISSELAGLFSPDDQPAHTSLDRLEERAGMLIELDDFIFSTYDSGLVKFMESSGSKLIHSGNGFYETLPAISAFRDPMKKKITFLLKLLEEAGMVTVQDPQHFIPIMDYHMQRVLLRMGCVEVTDRNLRLKLTRHESLDTDEEIRSACINAFRIIASVSGHAITKLNDFFWSLGRSCCNVLPLCQAHACEKEPCTFNQIVQLTRHHSCTFESVCRGFTDETYRNLWQPVVETHYY